MAVLKRNLLFVKKIKTWSDFLILRNKCTHGYLLGEGDTLSH